MVECDETGMPVEINSAVGRYGGTAVGEAVAREGGTAVRVTDVLETWLVNDEWWRPPGINRRYVEVIMERGSHVILFENLDTQTWFLQSA